MGSRAEITTKFAKAYAKASKKDKGRLLDEVVAVTGWSRDNARRRLTAAVKRPPGSGRQVAKTTRKPRSPKYSYDALKVLQKVWAASGGQCGLYLAASMRTQLDGLEKGKDTRSGDQILTTYTGTLPGAAVKQIIPSASAKETYDTAIGIDEKGYAITVKITGIFFSAGDDVTYNVKFSDYGKGVEITAPSA